MGCRSFALDLSILRQGLSIGREFGLASLEEFARLGTFLEHAFYETGSLIGDSSGIAFELENPPLRLGSFWKASLQWDGAPVPAERVSVRVGASAEPRLFSEIDRTRPLALQFGGPIRFRAEVGRPSTECHRIRLELESVAIPPRVWVEISDVLRWSGPP